MFFCEKLGVYGGIWPGAHPPSGPLCWHKLYYSDWFPHGYKSVLLSAMHLLPSILLSLLLVHVIFDYLISLHTLPTIFFSSIGVWTEDLVFAKQVFYHWVIMPALFCVGYFWDRVWWIFAWGWLRTMILLISASWVARITGVSHQHSAFSIFWSFPYNESLFPKHKSGKNITCFVSLLAMGQAWNQTLPVCARLGFQNKQHKEVVTGEGISLSGWQIWLVLSR
jgi:hypothetical protein